MTRSYQDLLIRQHSSRMCDFIFADKFIFARVSIFMCACGSLKTRHTWVTDYSGFQFIGRALIKTFYLYGVLLQNDARRWCIDMMKH